MATVEGLTRRFGSGRSRVTRKSWPTIRRVVIICAAAVFLTMSAHVTWSEDWLQFRGPNASGVSTSSLPLPTKFSSEENVRWSVQMGEGIGSPVVAGGRVFATAMSAETTFSVYAFDAETGRTFWRKDFDTGPLPPVTPPNSQASSTPCTDGRRVFVYFSTLGLLAFDAETGEELWHHELELPHYLMDWGAAASPIVYDGKVIFNQDDDLNPFLIALDAKTGRQIWRTPRPEMLGGYAVPVLCTAGGRTDVVVAGTGKLVGYDPDTGKELWNCNTLLRTIMTSPVVHKDMIYISVQSYGDTDRVLKYALLQWKDTNQDGKLSKDEMPKAFWRKFDYGDVNGDDLLVDEEIDRAFQSPGNMAGGGSIIQAIRGGGEGNVTDTHLVWELNNRAPSNLASPLLAFDRLFIVKKGGISSCFAADSGETIWKLKRIRNFGEYYASPVAGDGKIYVTGENGFIVVLGDGPQLKVVAKNDMGGSCIASPAIADGCLFIRTRDKLYCVGGK